LKSLSFTILWDITPNFVPQQPHFGSVEMSDWVFHFRNFDSTPTWFAVCHAGGDPFKKHDGRTECWNVTPTDNPTGGQKSVYNPSNWVVGFKSWWKIIKDGLDLIADSATYIASEGEDEDALEDAIKDAFRLSEDTAKGVIGDYLATHANLAEAVTQSRAQAAAAAGLSVEQVAGLAAQMGLDATGWVFVAGKPCIRLIHDDNEYNDNAGWSILCNPHGPLRHEVTNVLTNHAFINNGQLVFCWSSDLWPGKGKPGLWYNY
jgi:hypothetical protein